MTAPDSIDKIVSAYFRGVAKEAFYYKARWWVPSRQLRVSPLIFRGFTCPAGCGGCCSRFSLDYLPSEKRPAGTEKRVVFMNNEAVEIRSLMQETGGHHCSKLNLEDGRCNIHEINPFSCDFELIRFLHSSQGNEKSHLTQKLYGRGWALLRVDGERGALCEMTDPDQKTKREVVRKLRRLEKWCMHFGLEKTWVPEIIHWVKTGPHEEPLVLENKG